VKEYPYKDERPSNSHSQEVAEESKNKDKKKNSNTNTNNKLLCRFYQNENEILFVPRHWSHQVLNLETSLGFAVEVDNYVY
jgi:hypothetical protein